MDQYIKRFALDPDPPAIAAEPTARKIDPERTERDDMRRRRSAARGCLRIASVIVRSRCHRVDFVQPCRRSETIIARADGSPQDTSASIAGAFSAPRHRPEQTALYALIAKHYPRFVQEIERSGGHLPQFVRQEDYLKCGLLEHGFLRVKCDGCRGVKLQA